VFFVLDTIASGDWRVVLQKEPRNKHMVAEIDELLLGMDIAKQGGDEGKERVYRTNMGQANNEEGGEEVLSIDVQCHDAKLQRVCIDSTILVHVLDIKFSWYGMNQGFNLSLVDIL
jgi:hypothetical protein